MVSLKELGTDSAWIKASLTRLKDYSMNREREAFSKEAHHKSAKMRRRHVSRNEKEWKMYDEQALPSFLRRKLEQGKKQLWL